jgi:predicted membrane-bound spermidine synthase
MLGLPIGAFISNYMLNRKRISKRIQIIILCFIQIAIALISLLFPYLTECFDKYYAISKISIFLFTVVIGMLIGAIFPLSLNLYLGNHGKTGKTAGMIDGCDHLGGAIGAFFSGSIFLPIFGITGISTFIAALSFATALLLIVNLFHSTQYK